MSSRIALTSLRTSLRYVPNCHRRIHLSVFSDRSRMIVDLYSSSIDGLKMRGIKTSEKELLDFYRSDADG